MPRHPHPTPDWGTLAIGYTDEFGKVAPDVYETAGRIWRRARDFAQRVLQDADEARARTLLLKAASQVTRARDERGHHVNELDGYLLQTFKRIVLAESERDDNRRRFESEAGLGTEWRSQASNVERRILLAEIVSLMDAWTRSVFEWLTLDYTFDEVARHLGMNPKVLRNKYHRHVSALIKRVGGRRDGRDYGPERE
jgi:hypothetical protein